MILLVYTFVPILFLFLIYLSYFRLMRQYARQGATWISGKLDTDVSLIVATYNEESTLSAKLSNILEQDFPRDKLQLVLIDSGSTDTTPEIIKTFVAEHSDMNILVITEEERRGKSYALNIAYPSASGKIKIISDSDCLLERTAISRIVSNFSDPEIGAAFGWQVLLNPDENPTTKLEKSYKDVWRILRRGESILDSTPLFDGELSAYRADLIEPLPENKSGDDARMANIIRRKGYRAVCDSSAIFYEYAPPSSSSRSIQKVRRAQGLIRVFWDFRACMFRKEYGAYGRLILPMEFFLHCIFPVLWLFLIAAFLTSLAFTSMIAFFSLIGLIAGLLLISRVRLDSRFLNKVRTIADFGITFLISQAFLFYAAILWVTGRSLHKWQKVDDVRRKWRTDSNCDRQVFVTSA